MTNRAYRAQETFGANNAIVDKTFQEATNSICTTARVRR